MEVRIATPEDKTRWNEFVFSQTDGNFLQSWEWGSMQKLLGAPAWRLIAEEGSSIVGVVLVIKRELPLNRCWLYIPRGPVVVADNKKTVWAKLEDKVREIGKEEKAIFVRVDPFVEQGGDIEWLGQWWKKAEREVQPQHTQILDITPSEEDLLAGMHAKTRYNVRLAERKGVTVRFSTALQDIDTFLQLGQKVTERTDFHLHPDNYYRAMLSALAPEDMLEVAIAEQKEIPVAAHIMVYAGSRATYVHGASDAKYRTLMGPALTYWKTILRAKEKGMKTYDFFGVAPDDADKKHPWAGITRMKKGFGGKTVSYIGAHDLILDEGFYALVNGIRRFKKLWR